jgi:hypothetical protein
MVTVGLWTWFLGGKTVKVELLFNMYDKVFILELDRLVGRTECTGLHGVSTQRV